MIISFTFENWKSFRDETRFDMIASLERQHHTTVARVKKYPLRILPIAAIYGGNASGKSNFFSALQFMQRFVVNGTRPKQTIDVKPFILTDTKQNNPTKFVIELLIDETVYE
ncbi:MAG: ATP/GTP-binding protein, partial [Phycisphaeraceae bacterium JB051]